MVIFIDGPQQVGKSTLIKGFNLIMDSYKFPFSEYSKLLNFVSLPELSGFQLGKDLAMVEILSLGESQNLIVDRGPLSSAYYSLVEKRLPVSTISAFLQLISEKAKKMIFVFVTAKNNKKVPKRQKGDGFDDRFKDTSPVYITYLKCLLDKAGLTDRVIFFENDFNLEPSINEMRLEREICNRKGELGW